jgi:hypothetical protein
MAQGNIIWHNHVLFELISSFKNGADLDQRPSQICHVSNLE